LEILRLRSRLRLSYGAASRMTKCESEIAREHKQEHEGPNTLQLRITQ